MLAHYEIVLQITSIIAPSAAEAGKVSSQPNAIERTTDWGYAPAPESTAIVRLRDRYGLFVNGEFAEVADIP